MSAFTPKPHSTITKSVGTAIVEVSVSACSTVWIDNRGDSDLLLEFGQEDPSDDTTFRLPGYAAMPLSRPAGADVVRIKRPSGAATDTVYITQGYGE